MSTLYSPSVFPLPVQPARHLHVCLFIVTVLQSKFIYSSVSLLGFSFSPKCLDSIIE